MVEDKRKPSFRERYGQLITVAFLSLTGLTLIFASIPEKGLPQEALLAIGLNCLSSAAISIIILLLIGSDVGGLKSQINNLEQETNNLEQEVDKLHKIIENETDTIHKIIESETNAMYKNIGKLSTLLTDASSLGIVGLGRSKYSTAFEESKNFVERWKDLLEHAHEVDVICFADRSLFYYDVFDPFFIKKIQARMEQEGEKGLKLRIILSSEDNPNNKEINEWARDSKYTEYRIHYAKNMLIQLCRGTLDRNVVREHNSFVPFTLLRGDNYMYIMFLLPGHAAGPVLEIRPLEMIAHPRITDAEDDKKLFRIYKSYFDEMWLKCGESNYKSETLSKD